MTSDTIAVNTNHYESKVLNIYKSLESKFTNELIFYFFQFIDKFSVDIIETITSRIKRGFI